MTPEDLAKFNPGDKVLVTIEASLSSGRDCPEAAQTMPSLRLDLGIAELGGRNYVIVGIPDAAIVSIERVRLALPSPWFWHEDGRGLGAKISKGRMTPAAFVWRGDGEDIKVDIEDGGTRDIPFAVIEAVRNA